MNEIIFIIMVLVFLAAGIALTNRAINRQTRIRNEKHAKIMENLKKINDRIDRINIAMGKFDNP